MNIKIDNMQRRALTEQESRLFASYTDAVCGDLTAKPNTGPAPKAESASQNSYLGSMVSFILAISLSSILAIFVGLKCCSAANRSNKQFFGNESEVDLDYIRSEDSNTAESN